VKHQQIIAWLLIATASLVILGVLLQIHILWSVIDIIVVLVCSGSGFLLLRKNKQAE
jgi:hypothetical protein